MPLRYLQRDESYLWNGWLLFYVCGEGHRQQDNLQFSVSFSFAAIMLKGNNNNNSTGEILNVCVCCINSLCSCLNMSQSFPPGRFIWCNEGRRGGPTARPAARRGGHACCNDRDFCNLKLRPIIKQQSATPGGRQESVAASVSPSVSYEGALCCVHVF